MGNCCDAKAAFENATAASRPVTAEAIASKRAERVLYRFSTEMMPVQQDTNRPRFDFNARCHAILVTTSTPNSGIDDHPQRGADAAIDFGNVSIRTFDFLSFDRLCKIHN